MGDCQLEDLLDMMDDDEDEAMFAEAEAAALSQASQEVPRPPNLRTIRPAIPVAPCQNMTQRRKL